MRFLFCTRPYLGHLYPMVPLARELLRHGHRVVVASSAELESEVVAAGLEFRCAGLHPGTQLPRPADESRRAAGFSSGILQSKVHDLCATERADIVVREPTDLAAGIAAEVNSTPSVVLGRSHHISTANWRGLLHGDLDRVRAEAGLPPDPQLSRLSGEIYLDTVPPWFQITPPSVTHYAAVDGGSYDGASSEPLQHYPRMPYAYVSLGTVYHGDVEFFRVAIAALRERGIGAIVGAGSEASAAALAPLAADDCVIREFVPQSQVLCGADLVICHGGYSTVIGAIKAGLPLVCVPRGSDQAANALQCERLGVAARLSPAGWNPQAATAAISRLVDDDGPAERARALADHDDQLPSLQDVANFLEDLPALVADGENSIQHLKELAASRARDYRVVNRAGWQLLSRRRSAASRPSLPGASADARRVLDPQGWLPWQRFRTVLCLGAGGGQQGPVFASLGYEVLVADLCGEQLRRDREAATEQRLSIETLQADMCDLAALGRRQFDLVYQAVSTCYVPDLPTLYHEVAAHVRPGGWYWSQHYSPAHLQLDSAKPWDGTAYRIAHPYIEGHRIPWTTDVGDRTISISHYLHGLGALAGGICQAGFVLEQVGESEPAPGPSQPGDPAHLARYFPAFLTVLARRLPA